MRDINTRKFETACKAQGFGHVPYVDKTRQLIEYVSLDESLRVPAVVLEAATPTGLRIDRRATLLRMAEARKEMPPRSGAGSNAANEDSAAPCSGADPTNEEAPGAATPRASDDRHPA